MLNARRTFLAKSTAIAAGPILAAITGSNSSAPAQENAQLRAQDKQSPILPAELLMREHGVMSRVFLVYEEAVRRLRAKEELPPNGLLDAAKLTRNFFEDHHVKIEEELLFHQFIRRKLLNDTITVLTKQHESGRKLTDEILQLSTADQLAKPGNTEKLIAAVEAYNRMYRAHIAREDTVFYPMLAKVYTTTELKSFADQINEKEVKLFGAKGFEKLVEEVDAVEKRFKLDDLDSFTPRAN